MRYLCALILAALVAAPAHAQSLPEGLQAARLLPGWRKSPDLHIAALQLDLASGWKTYWRAPGEAGFAPRLDFAASGNIRSVRVLWPTPHAFDQDGIRVIGYKGRVTLPLEIRTAQAGAPAELNGTLDLGICATICVPVRLQLAQALPGQGGTRSGEIVAALADRPRSAAEAGVRDVRCAFTPGQDGIRVEASLRMPRLSGTEVPVIEIGGSNIYMIQDGASRQGDMLTARATAINAEGGPVAIDRSALRITVIGADRAVEIHGCHSG